MREPKLDRVHGHPWQLARRRARDEASDMSCMRRFLLVDEPVTEVCVDFSARDIVRAVVRFTSSEKSTQHHASTKTPPLLHQSPAARLLPASFACVALCNSRSPPLQPGCSALRVAPPSVPTSSTPIPHSPPLPFPLIDDHGSLHARGVASIRSSITACN